MVIQIQHRRDTSTNWTSANPTLASGEWGYETDTGKYKIGNGTTLWIPLPYVGVQGVIYDYLKLEPQGCMVPVTTPAAVDQKETGANLGNYVYGVFPVSPRTAQLQWKVTMPEDWKTDGVISAKFHWTSITGTPGEKVKWQIDGIQLADSDPLNTALVAIGTAEDTILTTSDLHISPAMTATTTGLISGTAGSVVIFKVTRIASSATESSADARLLGVSIKYIRTLL